MTSKEGSMTQVKICGFTDPKEAAFVSYPDVSYMGMVLFFEKSKRNISLETAKAILRAADPRIQKVAVVVSPSPMQTEEIEKAGFDDMQVHGVLGAEVLSMTRLPIIRAYNDKAEEEEDPASALIFLTRQSLAAGRPSTGRGSRKRNVRNHGFLRAALRQRMLEGRSPSSILTSSTYRRVWSIQTGGGRIRRR